MPCFRPLEGFRDPSGGFVFARHKSIGLAMRLPCGRCIGCKLERSRQWAVRCMHEASLHDDNCFVTLTYDEDHVPRFGSLLMDDWQKFFKRLRGRVGKVRFFGCGEYGGQYGRPHYHACLFGVDFPDKYVWAQRGPHDVFRSELLESVWTYGQSEIGSLTFESAAYVARYCLKKITGKAAESHYLVVERETGELGSRLPEFSTMSRRPGIGSGWFDLYSDEVYPSDEVIVNGAASKPPRFYDRLLEVSAPEVASEVRKERRRSRSHKDETAARLRVREVCVESRMNLYEEREL